LKHSHGFSRRLRELGQGKIELLVGLQREDDKQDEMVYLKLSHETLRHTFFVIKTNKDK
jgi:polar amino acid transport system substrate-binding protein